MDVDAEQFNNKMARLGQLQDEINRITGHDNATTTDLAREYMNEYFTADAEDILSWLVLRKTAGSDRRLTDVEQVHCHELASAVESVLNSATFELGRREHA